MSTVDHPQPTRDPAPGTVVVLVGPTASVFNTDADGHLHGFGHLQMCDNVMH